MKIPAPVVIFVRPQAAGNIGAMSRVMSNFDCRDLRLVGDSPVYAHREGDPFSRMDWAMACKGEPILSEAKWYPTLNDALFDCHVVIGTSGRDLDFPLGYARPSVPPEEAFQVVHDWQVKQGEVRWALVIGPEDDGLNAQDSALCQKLVRLPTVDLNPSMNAAMATGCFLYQWHLTNLGVARVGDRADTGAFVKDENTKRFSETGRGDWATHEHKEDFVDYTMETVAQTTFLKYPDTESVRARVRRWVQSAPIPLGELLFAFEIVYHLRSWGSGKYESRNFLGRRKKTTAE